MRKQVNDIVNLGLGATRSIEESTRAVLENFSQQLNELADKGAADDSEKADELRQAVSQAGQTVEEIVRNSVLSVQETASQFQSVMLELQDKINEMRGRPTSVETSEQADKSE